MSNSRKHIMWSKKDRKSVSAEERAAAKMLKAAEKATQNIREAWRDAVDKSKTMKDVDAAGPCPDCGATRNSFNRCGLCAGWLISDADW